MSEKIKIVTEKAVLYSVLMIRLNEFAQKFITQNELNFVFRDTISETQHYTIVLKEPHTSTYKEKVGWLRKHEVERERKHHTPCGVFGFYHFDARKIGEHRLLIYFLIYDKTLQKKLLKQVKENYAALVAGIKGHTIEVVVYDTVVKHK